MSHRNARLTVFGRRLLVGRVHSGRAVAHVAAEMSISRTTAHKWVRRWRQEGEAGLADRSSRPRRTPHRTPAATEACAQAAAGPQAGPGTHRPDPGPAWASTTCTPPSTTTPAWPAARSTATEKAATCAAFLRRAAACFHTAGITWIERVLTDNAWPYRKSFARRQALADLGAAGKLTRACRPQTNGKAERFNRTLLDERAYIRPYTSNTERTQALADFLYTYNHHRCRTALGGRPPISRVNSAAGQYTWATRWPFSSSAVPVP